MFKWTHKHDFHTKMKLYLRSNYKVTPKFSLLYQTNPRQKRIRIVSQAVTHTVNGPEHVINVNWVSRFNPAVLFQTSQKSALWSDNWKKKCITSPGQKIHTNLCYHMLDDYYSRIPCHTFVQLLYGTKLTSSYIACGHPAYRTTFHFHMKTFSTMWTRNFRYSYLNT